MYLSIAKVYYLTYKAQDRGVAQPGSASGLGLRGSQVQIFLPPRPFMKKAKIYIPSKTAMQSGYGKTKNWVLEFETSDPSTNSLMGWELSKDTLNSVRINFSTKRKKQLTMLKKIILILK